MNNSEESPLLPSDIEQESLEKVVDKVTPSRYSESLSFFFSFSFINFFT